MDIYTNNAFRILGLPVTASSRDIIRQVEELQTFIAIGQVPVYDYDLPWISKISRNENNIKKAAQTLENPRSRLLHILSWFWIVDEFDKLALDALKKQNIDDAVSIWTAASKDNSNVYYKKNLATLKYILCLKEIDSNSDHFYDSIEYWSDLASSGHLPHMINNFNTNRSRDICDVEVIDVMCEIISAPASTLLNKWLNDNKLEQINLFFKTLDESSLPVNIANYIKENFDRPLLDKIDKAFDELSSLNHESDHETLYDQTLSFYEKVKPYYDQLIQSGDIYLNESYGDKIGQIILNNAISYGNKSSQWKKSKSLVEMAEFVITGFLLKDRLEKNMQVISKNIQYDNTFANVKAIDSAPSFGGYFFGFGTELYGVNNYDDVSDSYETTKYFVFLGIPILPLSRYRVTKSSDKQYRFFGKVPFRHRDKWHLGLSVIGIILFFSFLIITDMQSNKSSYINKSKTTTAISNKSNNNYSGFKKLSPRSTEIALLTKKIINSKKRLAQRESELSQLDTTLENYNNRMNVLDEELENTKTNARLGYFIDKNDTAIKLNVYNNLVNKYNVMIANRKVKYNEYKILLKNTNDDVKRHNNLVKSNY